MNDIEIKNDREARVSNCKGELEAILKKYEFVLSAEDNWTPNTKVRVEISFVDIKKYPKAVLAQPTAPVAGTVASEGLQPDGSVVINSASLAAAN